MKFNRFAEYLEKLENTAKRLEMFEILSSLFKEANKDEVDKIVYFCEEKLLPSLSAAVLWLQAKRQLTKLSQSVQVIRCIF